MFTITDYNYHPPVYVNLPGGTSYSKHIYDDEDDDDDYDDDDAYDDDDGDGDGLCSFSNEIDTILHIVLINNTVIIVTITITTWPLFITVLHYCHYYNNYFLVLSFL